MDWLNDSLLYEELKKGNEDVLKSFFETFYPVYISFTLAYLDTKEECEDVVQEAFVQFWESRTTFTNIYYIRAFLYKTIRRKCLNIIRHKNVNARYARDKGMKEGFNLTNSSFFIDNIIREETSRMIYEEVRNLSEMGRKVIMLSIDGMSNVEIAEQLGISVNTVKTHKARTYQRLRIRLNELKIILKFLILS